MVVACTVPAGGAGAQARTPAGDSAWRVVGSEPSTEPLSATVGKFIEAQKPFASARPVDLPKPFAALSASVHSLRDSILVTIARTQIGTPYVRGGETPDHGFDCSGLVRYVLSGFHVPLPRTAAEQSQTGLAVGQDTNRLRPGDLITFGKKGAGVSHIGIYLGNGRFVHASSTAGRVIESNLIRPQARLIKPWRGARRVVSGSDDDPTVHGDG